MSDQILDEKYDKLDMDQRHYRYAGFMANSVASDFNMEELKFLIGDRSSKTKNPRPNEAATRSFSLR